MLIAYNALTIKKPLTGIPKFVLYQLKHLLKTDQNNKYLVFVNKDFDERLINLKNTELIRFNVKTPSLRIFYEQILIPLYLFKKKPKIYFSTSFVLPFLVIFFKHLKTIINAYDLSYIKTPETINFLTSIYYRLTFPFSFHKADLIFSISESTRKDIFEHFHLDDKKVILAYPALTLGGAISKTSLENLKLPKNYLLTVGRLEKRKNLLTLLKGYKIYADKTKNPIPLVLAGFRAFGANEVDSFIDENSLESLIYKPGHLEEEALLQLYSNASIFIYPSIYEGFGLPILEAFSVGVPVIASESSSIPEAGGNACVYIDPYSSEDIAQKIEALLSDDFLKNDLIEKGLLQLQKFSWQNHASSVLDALSQLETK